MVELSSPELKKAFKNYQAIRNIITYTKGEATRRGKNKDKFLETINFPFISSIKTKKKQNSISLIFNNLLDIVTETSILNIISGFEKQVFKKIQESSIKVKDIVNKNDQIEYAMYRFRSGFVKNSDDIFNLTGFNKFLDSHTELKNQLKEIILFRNYLAHGKRNNVGEPSNMTIEQITETLDNILELL